jgi:REG-2-like HAD superfamily hydrolase
MMDRVVIMSAFIALFLVMLDVNLAFKVMPTGWAKSRPLQCIDFEVNPVKQSDGSFRTDTDTSWQTAKSSVIPFKVDFGTLQRPELITFEARGVLIEPSQSIGRWYREALNTVCNMNIRLPKPKLFTKAFNKAYNEMCVTEPCFGAKSGMKAEEWWLAVVTRTYKETELLDMCIMPDEMEQLMPEVFEMLYREVFSTVEGWDVKEDAVYTLTKLSEWRDQGSGPKLGVLSNTDDRLSTILSALDLSKYFDFVATSYETKTEKPNRDIFDTALNMARLGAPSSSASYHIGTSVDSDVVGAVSAGWTALRYNPWFDEEFPDWYAINTEESAEEGAMSRKQLLEWGRRDLDKPAPGAANDSESRLEWIDLWGLDDVLHMFGFPADATKPIRTTYIRNVLDDE